MALKRSLVATAVLCFALSLFAKDKRVYQQAKLVSFKTVSTGLFCSDSGKSRSDFSSAGDNYGTAQTASTGSSQCADATTTLYTVASDGHTYVLRPLPRAWNRSSVLAGHLPGTTIEISLGKKAVLVRVGRDKSKFDLTEAR